MKLVHACITWSTMLLVFPVHADPSSTRGVTLTTDLDPPLASLSQVVSFYCNTTDSSILEWHSLEYIGENGLQILSHPGAQTSVSSTTNPSTTATRLSASGSTMIISQLQLIASTQYPLSSVTCLNDALGSSMTMSFNTFENYVRLTPETVIARPEQLLIFTCTTRGSIILEWESEEYIGAETLQTLSRTSTPSVTVSVNNPNTNATRVSSVVESGLPVIVSQLHIVASKWHPTASVTCRNAATGDIETVVFTVDEQNTRPTALVPNTHDVSTTSSTEKNSTTAAAAASDSTSKSMYIAVIVPTVVLVLLILLMMIAVVGFTKVYHMYVQAQSQSSKIHVESSAVVTHVKDKSQSSQSESESPRDSLDSGDMLLNKP